MGSGPRYPRGPVESVARELAEAIGGATVAGSLRRGAPLCGDVDLVAADRPREALVETLLARGLTLDADDGPRTELSLRVPWSPFRLQVDLWAPDPSFEGACLMHATGPGIYNSIMRRWAHARGLRLSWNGVWRGDERVAGATEAECCEALGWPNPPPEHRERFLEWIDPYLEILNEQAA